MNKLLTRTEFREGVGARDNFNCVVCGEAAVDSHHILERRLFSDGGYYLNNGASVCEKHHLECEMTLISVEQLRDYIGISNKDKVIPDHFYDDEVYDKWGNIILQNGKRLKGELFHDESVQKILAKGNVLGDFTDYVKYQRTYHCPWSQGITDDDRVQKDMKRFEGQRVIVTEKMDGENCVEASTMILTDQGEIRIDEIVNKKLDVKVLSVNHDTGSVEFQQITNYFDNGEESEFYEIELEDGTILLLTETHRVFHPVTNSYRMVKDLIEGDDVWIE